MADAAATVEWKAVVPFGEERIPVALPAAGMAPPVAGSVLYMAYKLGDIISAPGRRRGGDFQLGGVTTGRSPSIAGTHWGRSPERDRPARQPNTAWVKCCDNGHNLSLIL